MSTKREKKLVLSDGALQHRFLLKSNFNSLSDYYKSEKWKNFREEFLLEKKKKCELCEKTSRIELHHKHYRNLGECNDKEKESIVILCKTCHNKIHKAVKNYDLNSFWSNFYEDGKQQIIEICTNFFLENEKIQTDPKKFRNDEEHKRKWVIYYVNKSIIYEERGKVIYDDRLKLIGESNLLLLCNNTCACCNSGLDYYLRLDQIYVSVSNTNFPSDKHVPVFSRIDVSGNYEEGNVQVICKDCSNIKNFVSPNQTPANKKTTKKSKDVIIKRRKSVVNY